MSNSFWSLSFQVIRDRNHRFTWPRFTPIPSPISYRVMKPLPAHCPLYLSTLPLPSASSSYWFDNSNSTLLSAYSYLPKTMTDSGASLPHESPPQPSALGLSSARAQASLWSPWLCSQLFTPWNHMPYGQNSSYSSLCADSRCGHKLMGNYTLKSSKRRGAQAERSYSLSRIRCIYFILDWSQVLTKVI